MFHGTQVLDGFGNEHTVLYAGGVQSGTTNLTLVAGQANKKIVVLSMIAISTVVRVLTAPGGAAPVEINPGTVPLASWHRGKKPLYTTNSGSDLVIDSTDSGGTILVIAYAVVDA